MKTQRESSDKTFYLSIRFDFILLISNMQERLKTKEKKNGRIVEIIRYGEAFDHL